MNYDTPTRMHLHGFTTRLLASGLSRWELADLLGVHPHELSEDELAGLADRPVRVLIELARRLDMHPADLVYELDQVLANPRIPPPADPFTPPDPAPQPPADPLADARTLMAALAHAPYALTPDHCAQILRWPGPRVHAALDTLRAHPDLAGPLALRHEPPGAYTLTPRLGPLTPSQIEELATTRPRYDILGRDQATALYTVITTGYREDYVTGPARDRIQEDRLRQAGLIHGDPDHGQPLYASDDILFSLRRTGPRHSPRWDSAHRRRLDAAQARAAERARHQPRQPAAPDLAELHAPGEEAVDLTPYDTPPTG
ncbi:hypothetical protein [Bailinhaonella thermotolerans]|uniref:hypothetical protein n=1 Tax=Bailinhaonella thermotolerans TaxID=1070861 RepID=UPI00192A5CB8|nr:hypothetical protein [Bailinhaonella thermotolerans]